MTGAARGRGAPDAEISVFRALAPHWRVTLAAFLGWFLDAFDQVALLLCLPDMGRDLGVDLAAMGFVLTAQSIGRVFGNAGWGWLADRHGRKLAFMVGVVWFAFFSGATALATGYVAICVIQFLFGIGFGGEWTASAALLMESVPERTRPLASSIMMAGYEVGFFCAAAAQALVLPHFGWRGLFALGIVPALLALFVRIGVSESPVWLDLRARGLQQRRAFALPRLNGAALQAVVFMAVLQFQNAALYAFYPALLRTERHLAPGDVFPMIAAYCAGSLVGKPVCGLLATRFGNRATLALYFVLTLAIALPFAQATAFGPMIASAWAAGAFGAAVWALVPQFLAERFASATRSSGMGISYAAAALGQAVSGFVVPALAARADLGTAVASSVVCGTLVLLGIVSFRPFSLPGAVMERKST